MSAATAPTKTEPSGRDTKGRFVQGNSFATGNPFAKRTHALRAALLASIRPEDIREVIEMLLAKAKRGDVVAARELLDRTLGKPAQAVAVTGPDGEPLGVTLQAVQVAVLAALEPHPEAKFAVAARLRELSLEHAQANSDGA